MEDDEVALVGRDYETVGHRIDGAWRVEPDFGHARQFFDGVTVMPRGKLASVIGRNLLYVSASNVVNRRLVEWRDFVDFIAIAAI